MHKIFKKDNKIMPALLNKETVNSISDKPPLYWTNSRKGCLSLCNETIHVEAVTCDAITLECKYTCNQGYGGDHCQYDCDYNCLKCGSELIEANKVSCDLCNTDYYYFNERCEECKKCSKDPNSTESSCDQAIGTCRYGCIGKYCSPTCTSECSNFCINKTCGFDCCCTEGCLYDVLGGCRCDEVCPTACFDKTCYPDLTCKVCEVNHWGPKCEYTCNDHCQDATSTSISACDRDGKCLFGCEKTFWGNTCSTNCPDNCLGKDCNASTGQCVQGCIKSYWGDVCENDCSMKCLETDCYRFNATCRLGCVNGDYGMNCSMKCSENCLNGTCFRENGTCSLGCDGDYIGEQCNEPKLPATEPLASNDLIIGITAGGFGGGVIALIIAALIIRNRYRKPDAITIDKPVSDSPKPGEGGTLNNYYEKLQNDNRCDNYYQHLQYGNRSDNYENLELK